MDSSIRATLLRTAEIALRRRWLLVVPFLVMLPVSVAAAMLLGGGYAARSLVMLQEAAASNPLAHDGSAPNADRMAQMLKGLRALLVSDYVLAPVVETAGAAPLDPATRASLVKELAKNVSVDLLGNDFLEFRLAGSSPKGLGDRLQNIMTNLIGALTTPPGETAGSFALRALQASLHAEETRQAALNATLAGRSPADVEAARLKLSGLQQLRTSLEGQLPNTAPGSRKALQSRIAELADSIAALASQIGAYELTVAQRDELATTIGRLRSRIDAETPRARSDSAATWSSMINAPERMIVVDPPKDPDLRTKSRLYFLVSGVFGGILLGIALVVLAEIFDTTLRSPEQMVAIAGVPCLGSLPLLASADRKAIGAAGVGRLLLSPSHLATRRLHHEA